MKTIRIVAIILLVLVSVNALVAGYLLMTDPTGNKMQLPLTLLLHSPFNNFLIPGIILFLVNGVFALITALLTIFKHQNYSILVSWQGVFLIGWIVIQIILIREFNMLHLIIGSIGILLFMFGNRLNV
ncbi:MAG TPA: hypothetical protein VFF27_06080 [Bacteroidia bacterium]|jgi:hypothetical protein|nr:hypothetical protein [Bacteroidia bacterium]